MASVFYTIGTHTSAAIQAAAHLLAHKGHPNALRAVVLVRRAVRLTRLGTQLANSYADRNAVKEYTMGPRGIRRQR